MFLNIVMTTIILHCTNMYLGPKLLTLIVIFKLKIYTLYGSCCSGWIYFINLFILLFSQYLSANLCFFFYFIFSVFSRIMTLTIKVLHPVLVLPRTQVHVHICILNSKTNHPVCFHSHLRSLFFKKKFIFMHQIYDIDTVSSFVGPFFA